MIPDFGDIYLTKFYPSAGRELRRIRPALVIQERNVSKKSPYIAVLPISSQIHKLEEADVFLAKDNLNRLDTDSVIKSRHISSFDQDRLLKKIGRVGSPVTRKVRGYLRKHFGL